MSEEIKSCPCCGRSPTLEYRELDSIVYCPDCPDAEARNGIAAPTEDEATKLWNTVVHPSVYNRMLTHYETNQT